MTVVVSTSGKLHSEFVRLFFSQVHREIDRVLTVSGVQPQHDRGSFHFLHTVFSAFKSRVGLTLAKVAVLRIMINIDGLVFIFRCIV